MKTLISKTPTNHFNPQLQPPNFLSHFLSLSRENPNFLQFSRGKPPHNPKPLKSSSFTGFHISNTSNYGGWDDLGLGGGSNESGESNQFRNFMVSLGIDDKKYLFVFVLGLVCALAISRVRVSSIVVFPACVLVFGVGFSFGFVRGGGVSEVSVSKGKRRFKEESFRVCVERLRGLVDFFDVFDLKVSKLKSDVKRAIDSNHVTVDDLESNVEVIESIRLLALPARNVVEASIDSMGLLGGAIESNGVLVDNSKPNKRRKELGNAGFDLLQFVGGLFGEKVGGPKPNKTKDNKREAVENEMNNKTRENMLASAVDEVASNSVNDNKGNANVGVSQCVSSKPAVDWDGVDRSGDGATRINVIQENGQMDSVEMDRRAKKLIESKEYSYLKNRLRSMNNHQISMKMDHHSEIETWASHESVLDSVDFSVSLKHVETEASFGQKQRIKKSSEAYRSFQNRENSETETHGSRISEERVNPEDDPYPADNWSAHEGVIGSSSSSIISDDVLFDRYLTEANSLVKQARECLKGRGDEGHAEIKLYKSAKLLLKAIAMKPMSLLAVGQLGNTFLLHGELKLKISRELRNLLSGGDFISVEKQSKVLKGLDGEVTKNKVASVLINVCEECEELLVEAGRKYRLALSIDGNDVRALYNWGLALSFRAQLIADIGPEAAFDADKVFLAAIDKFDAMMSKGNAYAPDALYRWGVVLQQRSQLRPGNSKERVKLLQQAKRLYEDALHVDTGNLQVREALSSCISELNFRQF